MRDEERSFIEGALPFWSELEPEAQTKLLDGMSRRKLAPGTVLHGGGGDCDGLFLLRSGQVRVFIVSEAGKEITLYRLFERDICLFSAACLFRNISFDVMVEGDTNVVLQHYKDSDSQIISREISEPTPRLINQTINYLDNNGKRIAPSIGHNVMTGMIYQTKRRVFPGYLLTETPSNADDCMNESNVPGTVRTIKYHGGIGATIKYTQMDDSGTAIADIYYGGAKIGNSMMLEPFGHGTAHLSFVGGMTIPLENYFGNQTRTINYVYKRLGSWKISVPGKPEQDIAYQNDPSDSTKIAAQNQIVPYVEGYTVECSNGSLQQVSANKCDGYRLSAPEDPFKDGVVSYVADNSAEINANGENQNPQQEKVTAGSNNDRNVRKFQVDRQKDQPRQTEVIAPTKFAVKQKAAQPSESKKNFGLLPQTGDFSSNLCFFGAVIVGLLVICGLVMLDRRFNLDNRQK